MFYHEIMCKKTVQFTTEWGRLQGIKSINLVIFIH